MAHAGDVKYTVTDLGTLGGPNVVPTGITSSGQVTGNADGTVAGTGYAFLWTKPGPMMSLGALGSLPTQSNANGINDSEWIVGQSNSEGFVYTPQTGMQGVGFLGTGTESTLYAITSDANIAVGGGLTVGGSYAHAAIWDPTNGLRDLNTMIVNPPATWTPTGATCISQNGIIAGIGYDDDNTVPPSGAEHAFVLSGGSLTVIPSLGSGVYPRSINASGEVVGEYFDNTGQHAFVYTSANGIREIGDPSAPIAIANAVTDSGLVLGGLEMADGSGFAFLYTDAAGIADLNTLVNSNGWTLDDATGINRSGQIVCEGVNSNTVFHGFVLTPTPEPGTIDLFAISVIIFLIFYLAFRIRGKYRVLFAAGRDCHQYNLLEKEIAPFNNPVRLSDREDEETGLPGLRISSSSCNGSTSGRFPARGIAPTLQKRSANDTPARGAAGSSG